MNELQDIKAEIESVNYEIEKAQNIIFSIPEMKEEVEILKEKNAALLLKVPDDIAIADIASKLREASARPGVRLVSLSPEKDAERTAAKINISSDFFSLGELMEQIESSGMPVSILKLHISGTPIRAELDVRMVISGFFREKYYD